MAPYTGGHGIEMHLQALNILGPYHLTTPNMIYDHDLEAGMTWLARVGNWSHLFSAFVLLEITPYQARLEPGNCLYRLHPSAGPTCLHFSTTLFHHTF